VGPGAIVGDGPFPDKPNKAEPSRLNTGITVVGKRAVIPRGARIGRNVKVAADVRTTDFVKRVVRSGESVEARPASRPRGERQVVAPIPAVVAPREAASGSRGKGGRPG
jgi:hypothetical protein